MAKASAQLDDWQSVKAVLAGDEQAFSVLVARYHRRLENYMRCKLADEQDVRDLMQEVFIKAYDALENFRYESQFYTWLHSIATNVIKNYHRARSTRIILDSIEELQYQEIQGPASLETPENFLMLDELGQQLDDVLLDLPEGSGRSLLLRDVGGLSYEEIATLLACPLGTIRSRIHRARKVLSERLLR